MKPLVVLAIAGLIVFQVSRHHEQVQKQALIDEHEVVPAMTRTEVRQSLGTPSATSRDETGLETWTYTYGTFVTYVVFAREGVLYSRREALEAGQRPVVAAAARGEVPHAEVRGANAAGVEPFRSVGSRLDLDPRRIGSEVVSRVGRPAGAEYPTGGRPGASEGEQAVRRVPGVVVDPYLHH